MREIKFRAWDTIHGKISNNFALMDCINQNQAFMMPENFVFMQYTGLKDKNGVEIYEGDIIRAKHTDGKYDVGEVVYGHKGAFCLYLPNVGTGVRTPLLNYIFGMMFFEYDFEVIGNRYENPDLLAPPQVDKGEAV